MDLSDTIIQADTHPLLMRLAHAYQPSIIPIPEDLKLLTNVPHQIDGWLNLKDMCADMGVDYDEEMDRRRELIELASEMSYKDIIEAEMV